MNKVDREGYTNFGTAIERARVDVVYFAEEFLGMPLHEGQKQFLRAPKSKINNLVPANRWGKSILVAVIHLHMCFFKIGVGTGNDEAWLKAAYMTANLAPHSDATKPVFDAILAIMRSTFVIPQEDGSVRANECKIGWLLDEAHIRNTTPYVIPFNNNTQVIFRSTGEDKGDSIQGKNFGYISFDEGGRDNHLRYVVDSNVIPRLADLDGRLDIISTPDMQSRSLLFHYEMFEKGQRHEYGYYSQEGSIMDNIFLLRNNPDYVSNELKRLGNDPILQQVLYGKFVFAGDALYPADDILEAKTDDLNDGEAPKKDHSYIIAVDTAMGEDEMVFDVVKIPKKDCDCCGGKYQLVRQIACKGNSKSPQIHSADFEALVRSYLTINNVQIIIETWNGESARFYMDLPYDLQVITKCFGAWQPQGVKVFGRNGKNVRKAEILLALRKLLAGHELLIPNDSALIKQLSIYREDDTNLPTDRVIALALASWLATDGAIKHNNEVIEIDL